MTSVDKVSAFICVGLLQAGFHSHFHHIYHPVHRSASRPAKPVHMAPARPRQVNYHVDPVTHRSPVYRYRFPWWIWWHPHGTEGGPCDPDTTAYCEPLPNNVALVEDVK